VIELRQQTVAVMDISAASMMNVQRIQAHLDVYLANRGSGPPNQLGDCARITGYPRVIHMPDAVVVQVESCQKEELREDCDEISKPFGDRHHQIYANAPALR
jgi:hypothetical protein